MPPREDGVKVAFALRRVARGGGLDASLTGWRVPCSWLGPRFT